MIRNQVDVCKAQAQEAVKIALDLEGTPHFTQNSHYFQTLRERWLAYYKMVRMNPAQYNASVVEPSELSAELSEDEPELPVETLEALRALAEAGYPNLRVSDLARLLPPDSWEEELIVMADVRAYYQVGYKVSCARQLYFKASESSSSVSSTIFLLRLSTVSTRPWRNGSHRASSRAC